jgi:hypothetical protein
MDSLGGAGPAAALAALADVLDAAEVDAPGAVAAADVENGSVD